MTARDASKTCRLAVIDIGSNSVRLVIYDGPRRAPFPICNEKSLCGLGRDMTDDGALNPAAISAALATLRRFRRILIEHGDPPLRVVATAAVREARNGAKFVKEVAKLGFAMEVIGGGEEATLAALGVASLEPGAAGIVGDMGGGSLELASLDAGSIGDAVSLSIGPLRLMQHSGGNLKAAAKEIDAALSSIDWLKKERFNMLYMVGGAWRAVARIHMRLRNHPLPILHHYEMTARQAIEVCDLIAKQSRSSLEEIPGIPAKRLDTLPFAALVLKAVIERAKIQRLFVSGGGVREGLLYRDLTVADKALDPLLAGAKFLADRFSPEKEFGAAAFELMDKLFVDETAGQRRIRMAACSLIDTCAYFHPDMRGVHAFDTALRAPLYGVTHSERVALALSVYIRYAGFGSTPNEQMVSILAPEDRKRAIAIGLAMRFAAAVSPKIVAPLRRCSLTLEKGKLTFAADSTAAELMGEYPRKRLEALASFIGAQLVETYSD